MINLYFKSLLSFVPSSWILFFLLYTLFLCVWYLAAMYYLRHKHDLRSRLGLLFYVVEAALVIGVIGDVVYNWTLGVVVFLDITRDLTLSERLSRYRSESKYADTWRYRIATSICRELNKHDPEGHC